MVSNKKIYIKHFGSKLEVLTVQTLILFNKKNNKKCVYARCKVLHIRISEHVKTVPLKTRSLSNVESQISSSGVHTHTNRTKMILVCKY